jgi:hypothetical protein
MEINVYYTVCSAYRASFAVGGIKYTVWIGDMTGNGRFTDAIDTSALQNQLSFPGRSPLRTQADMVYLSGGKKPELATDGLAVGDYLVIGNTLFAVKIDLPEKKLILTEIKTGLGFLKLPGKTEHLSLWSPDTGKSIMAYRPRGDALPLPIGNYRLLSYQMIRTDAQGDLWRLGASGTKDSPVVTVTSGGPATLVYGEPFEPAVDLPAGPTSLKTMNAPLRFWVEGRGKEIVSDITHLEGTGTKIPLSKVRNRGNRPKEPDYTIVKSDGEIVARGSFEYG